MKKHIKIFIFGSLKDAGFRFYAMEMAYKYGVFGIIRHRRDGSLYIEAEGEEKPLDDFLIWCRKGPQGSRIKKFRTKDGTVKDYKRFDIKH